MQHTWPYYARLLAGALGPGLEEVMAASPTVRRKRLGIELRRLREQARLTCEEVGQRLD
jgi:hypothetical protein